MKNDDEVGFSMMQPARHGWVMDLQVGARRVHVRVFEFEEGPFQGGTVEMPVALDLEAARRRLSMVLVEVEKHLHPAFVVDCDSGKIAPETAPLLRRGLNLLCYSKHQLSKLPVAVHEPVNSQTEGGSGHE
ncbi:hypothetical protein [Prosthecobacter sp.]|uniref:hypothetical protein n=1 Tax=Prosthecobacter sp. TaxID=1965333 RepID=UPI003783DD93